MKTVYYVDELSRKNQGRIYRRVLWYLRHNTTITPINRYGEVCTLGECARDVLLEEKIYVIEDYITMSDIVRHDKEVGRYTIRNRYPHMLRVKR